VARISIVFFNTVGEKDEEEDPFESTIVAQKMPHY
jgi:hypothetical protein